MAFRKRGARFDVARVVAVGFAGAFGFAIAKLGNRKRDRIVRLGKRHGSEYHKESGHTTTRKHKCVQFSPKELLHNEKIAHEAQKLLERVLIRSVRIGLCNRVEVREFIFNRV